MSSLGISTGNQYLVPGGVDVVVPGRTSSPLVPARMVVVVDTIDTPLGSFVVDNLPHRLLGTAS